MNRKITIVMYHYVREVRTSSFPEIKARSIKEFENQIRYFSNNHNVISIGELLAAINDGVPLPPNPVLLTFDDGYIDHYNHVLPILIKYNMSGCFYPCGKTIDEKNVLDVNKIHFIIAAACNQSELLSNIFTLLDTYRREYNLKSNEFYYRKLNKPNDYDTGSIIFIKRLLQRELKIDLREKIINELFRAYVTKDEKGFSESLYMNRDQIKEMVDNKMHVGSHGYDHYWLDTLSAEKQQNDIVQSVEFLKSLHGNTQNMTISYPYGACNNDLLEIIKYQGFSAGFIVDGRIADISIDSMFQLPRMDTNQFPII